MKTIYIVRHGQSTANVGMASADPARIALTDLGRQQSLKLAGLLHVAPAQVITSTYERAMDTAIPYCDKWAVTPLRDALLREFTTLSPDSVAHMDGQARLPLIDAYWKASDPQHRHGAGAETFAELAQRVRTFQARLDTLTDNTVIFGHGLWFALLIWQLQHFSDDDHDSMRAFRKYQLALPMPNCGVYRLQSSRQGVWSVHFDSQLFRQLQEREDRTSEFQALMHGA